MNEVEEVAERVCLPSSSIRLILASALMNDTSPSEVKELLMTKIRSTYKDIETKVVACKLSI